MGSQENTGLDTEKGFGTGLRAQLARRTDAEPVSDLPEETTTAAPASAGANPFRRPGHLIWAE